MPRFISLLALSLVASIAFTAEPPPGLPNTVAPDAKLSEVFGEKFFYEGPTWDPVTKKLYFTAFGKDITQIRRLDETGKAPVWMDQTKGINGMFLTTDGHFIGCQGDAKSIVSFKVGANGPEDFKVIAHDDKWNRPNDLVQTRNGDIYFTDPDFKDRKLSTVYRICPDGKVSKVSTDATLCNGIIASLDGKTLYVGDSWEKLWRSYSVHADDADGTLTDMKVFFNPDVESKADPDGCSIDEHGNLYFTGRGGVWAVTPAGKALGLIPVKEFCSNVTFGGEDGRTLYMTCADKVYSLQMAVRGGQFKK